MTFIESIKQEIEQIVIVVTAQIIGIQMKVINKLIFCLIVIFAGLIYPQKIEKITLQGKVTYMSSKNIYVKYDDTEGINPGDILYKKSKDKFIPIIKVKYISKISVAGELLNGDNLKIGEIIFAIINRVTKEKDIKIKSDVILKEDTTKWISYDRTSKIEKDINLYNQNISGRLTINSSSNFSNLGNSFNYQRWRYSFRLSAKNIGGSKISLANYSTFTYRADQWVDVKNNLSKSLKIYDLSLQYDVSDKTNIWVGRHLNRTISNIGPVDGIQFEHAFSDFSIGAAVGFRPDFVDMSINSKLLELGVYLTKQNLLGKGIMTNTLAFFQQNNNSSTDRRFLYFQHSNNIFSGLNFFISSEVDLFKKEAGVNKNTLTLTSLYLSTNIRPSKFISFSVSYDARKDVIYYETFKTFLDSVITNETRQGFRIRTTIHPFKRFTIGSHFGYRYRKGDIKPHRNYGGFLSFTQIPILDVSPTFTYNKILSSYIEGDIWGIRISKRLFTSSVDLMLGYKKSNYTFSNNSLKNTQENVELGLSTRIFDSLFMSLNYEGIFESNLSTGHIFVTLSLRF